MAAATSSGGKSSDPGAVLRNLCHLLLVKKQHQLLLEQSKRIHEPHMVSSNQNLPSMLLQQQLNPPQILMQLPEARLMSGKLNPQKAFFQGKLKIQGNMGLAMKLQEFQKQAAQQLKAKL